MAEYSWLLLSDLHLKSSYGMWSQSVVLRDLVRDVKTRAESHPPIKFIIISGDLAHGGKPSQYELVEAFLDDLLSELQLTRADVFLVPGNHDIDRGVNELAFYGARAQFTDANQVERYLANSSERTNLLRRLDAFYDFESRFSSGVDRRVTEDGLAYLSIRSIDGCPIAVIGLNSALTCGNDEDEQQIVVGDQPIIDIVEMLRDADARLVIGVLHHPPLWLRDFDQRTLVNRFLPICDILHRGHLHEHGVKPIITSPDSKCLVVAAGASYVWRQFQNSYSFVSLDVAQAKCTVTNYEYDSHSGTFAVADTQSHPVNLRGELPGDLVALTEAIHSLSEPSGRFAPYLAALITGRISDVPLSVDGVTTFGARSLLDLSAPAFVSRTERFLNVVNSLQAYSAGTTIDVRVAENSEPIIGYAALLDSLSAQDATFCADLQSRVEQAGLLCGVRAAGPENTFIAAMDQFVADEDWLGLEEIARRYQSNADSHISRVATSRLALALAQSELPEKRKEARTIVSDLIRQPDVAEADHLLAFAIHRAHGEDKRAEELFFEAIEKTAALSEQFIQSAYAFSAETGNLKIREALDAARQEESR